MLRGVRGAWIEVSRINSFLRRTTIDGGTDADDLFVNQHARLGERFGRNVPRGTKTKRVGSTGSLIFSINDCNQRREYERLGERLIPFSITNDPRDAMLTSGDHRKQAIIEPT